ncbi:growth arrest-specific protein 2 [Stylonychia lemnae]|uniref:Growth arrest-specific protein 2 n=1 Tax=Stylonychia lemnae TaxID=5949 RepID=A0A078AZA2_STYLE|nr:growth arrest-specific protein 2 [Stylonychia lemnae]|eukprot:CDW86537.1 growth arrest-specific protein 2 [Stylonychia lemnae]
MGLVCCAYERDRETKTTEMSSTHKVRITFSGTQDYASGTPEGDIQDPQQYPQDEEPTPTTTSSRRESVKKPANLKRYKSIRGDQVDEIVEKIVYEMDIQLPIIRILQGRYLIGTEYKMLMIKNDSCMVRVGGGFEKLEEYIMRNQDAELDKIKRMMVDNGKSFAEVMTSLLEKFNADKTVIFNYQKYSKYNIPEKCLPQEHR